MSTDNVPIKKTLEKWNAKLKQGYDHDSWGQIVEATDTYNSLAKVIFTNIQNNQTLSNDVKNSLEKLAKCLQLRSNYLQNINKNEEISLKEIKQLQTGMFKCSDTLFIKINPKLPSSYVNHRYLKVFLDVINDKEIEIPEELQKKSNLVTENLRLNTPPAPTQHQSVTEKNSYNSLKPRLARAEGETLVTFHIDKIAMKDARNHIDPYFVISCKDLSAVNICKPQQTPTCSRMDETYIYYGVDFELQVPIEKMPRGSAVFFEFFHYKHKKRMTSNKCFAFMEMDELKPGPCVIELYKKPTDYKRKKISLLTAKPLYLHLNLTLHK